MQKPGEWATDEKRPMECSLFLMCVNVDLHALASEETSAAMGRGEPNLCSHWEGLQYSPSHMLLI